MPNEKYESIEQVLQIARSTDREFEQRELKRYGVLRGDDKDRLVRAIVALCNRDGGEILLGLNDDGSLEGVKARPDADRGQLEEICRKKISPRLFLTPYYLTSSAGDVMVVDVPPRGDVPLAVVKRDGDGRIRTRAYFIRDSHGVSPVSDDLLAQFFRGSRLRPVEAGLSAVFAVEQGTNRFPSFIGGAYQHRAFDALDQPRGHGVHQFTSGQCRKGLSASQVDESIIRDAPFALMETLFPQVPPISIMGGPSRPVPSVPPVLRPDRVPEKGWQVRGQLSERRAEILARAKTNCVFPCGAMVTLGESGQSPAGPGSCDLEVDFPQGQLRFSIGVQFAGSGIYPELRPMLWDRKSSPPYMGGDSPFRTVALGITITFMPALDQAPAATVAAACEWVASLAEWLDEYWGYARHLQRYPLSRIVDIERKLDRITDMLETTSVNQGSEDG